MKKVFILLLTFMAFSCSVEENEMVERNSFAPTGELTKEQAIELTIGTWELSGFEIHELNEGWNGCPWTDPPNSVNTAPPTEEWKGLIIDEVLSNGLTVTFNSDGSCVYGGENYIWRFYEHKYGNYFYIHLQKADPEQLNGDYCYTELRKYIHVDANTLSFDYECYTTLECPGGVSSFGQDHISTYTFTRIN